MRCNCNGHVHTFTCFVRNIVTDGNRQVNQYPDVLNAR